MLLLTFWHKQRILRYAFVGAIAFVADTSTLFSFTEFLHTSYLLAAGCGFSLGVAINYLLSRIYVFSDAQNCSLWTFGIFVFIGIVGLGLNELIMWLCTDGLGLYYMLSKIVAVIIVFIWNYFARKKYCFGLN